MSKLVSLFCLWFVGVLSQNFDPTKFDYCTRNCADVVHSACNCKRTGNRREITEDYTNQEFRKIMLERHNDLRNAVANGSAQAEYPQVYAATNMRVLNYDLELEYIARCYVLTSFHHPGPGGTGHDFCKVMHDGRKVSQNITYRNILNQTSMFALMGWYREAKDLTATTLVSYTMKDTVPGGGKIGHFTLMMWAQVDMVGCVRGHNPDVVRPVNSYLVLCNYAMSDNMDRPNTRGLPVYRFAKDGKKICSECPRRLPCGADERYKALCGKPRPVPQDPKAYIEGVDPDPNELQEPETFPGSNKPDEPHTLPGTGNDVTTAPGDDSSQNNTSGSVKIFSSRRYLPFLVLLTYLFSKECVQNFAKSAKILQSLTRSFRHIAKTQLAAHQVSSNSIPYDINV